MHHSALGMGMSDAALLQVPVPWAGGPWMSEERRIGMGSLAIASLCGHSHGRAQATGESGKLFKCSQPKRLCWKS